MVKVASFLTVISLSSTGICNDKAVFSFSADDCKISIVTSEIASHFGCTLLVSSEIKNKEVTGNINGHTLETSLESLCWLVDTTYRIEDGIYYIGGSVDKINVLDSAGLGLEITRAFTSVRMVGDKVVVSGNESEVNRISKAITSSIDRDYLNAEIQIVQYQYNVNNDFMFNLDTVVQGKTISFSELGTGSESWRFLFDSKSSSVGASLNTIYDDIETNVKLNTKIGLLSGHETQFHVGTTEERPIFKKVTDIADEFITQYRNFESGIEVSLLAYRSGDNWILTTDINNSVYTGSLIKDQTRVNNSLKIKRGESFILADFNKTISEEIKDGWIYKIPYLKDYLPAGKKDIKQKIVVVLTVS